MNKQKTSYFKGLEVADGLEKVLRDAVPIVARRFENILANILSGNKEHMGRRREDRPAADNTDPELKADPLKDVGYGTYKVSWVEDRMRALEARMPALEERELLLETRVFDLEEARRDTGDDIPTSRFEPLCSIEIGRDLKAIEQKYSVCIRYESGVRTSFVGFTLDEVTGEIFNDMASQILLSDD